MSYQYRYFNSSPEIIRLAILMYVKYPLSLRHVEDLLFERGIDFVMRLSASGGTVSAQHWLQRSERNVFHIPRNIQIGAGILMKSSSKSEAKPTIFGVPSIMKVTSLTPL